MCQQVQILPRNQLKSNLTRREGLTQEIIRSFRLKFNEMEILFDLTSWTWDWDVQKAPPVEKVSLFIEQEEKCPQNHRKMKLVSIFIFTALVQGWFENLLIFSFQNSTFILKWTSDFPKETHFFQFFILRGYITTIPGKFDENFLRIFSTENFHF